MWTRMISRYRRSWFGARINVTNGIALIICITIVALIASVTSLYHSSTQRERNEAARHSAQIVWDAATKDHDDCVRSAQSRDDTIITGHAQFAREASTLDLLESLVHLGTPGSPFVLAADQKIAIARTRLASDLIGFDKLRPPIDSAFCSPAPTWPRP
jgi:hypothetical protein